MSTTPDPRPPVEPPPVGQLGRVQHITPDGLPRDSAFTHAVVVSGAVRTVYVGGQDAVDPSGAVVGVGDIGAQAEQVLQNLRTALAAPVWSTWSSGTCPLSRASRLHRASRRSSAPGVIDPTRPPSRWPSCPVSPTPTS